jgi:Ras GTPase-activating-like protein IQGAP2/3
MPFTKQYFHLRDLQKSGKLPQFGSFKYSAHDLYDKGILLSIDQYSPRQFDKLDIIISSNQVGVFTMEVLNNALGITNRMATTDLRMEDLLQAQFDNKASLTIFNGTAKVNLTALLLHINKKCVCSFTTCRYDVLMLCAGSISNRPILLSTFAFEHALHSLHYFSTQPFCIHI